MHDWTLVKITYEWEKGGSCRIQLRDRESATRYIDARNVFKLLVPRDEEWGPSVSVNSVAGPVEHSEGQELKIEMQSGDTIVVVALEIKLLEKHME